MGLSSGTRLGPYEIAAPLGAGGMGEVYRARDTRLDRTVALKVVRTELAVTDEGRRRFEREARAISQINHPNVCALYDVGREADREFLVMELVEGDTLAARLARRPLPIGDLLRLGREMALGLDAAHRRGIVHRDFKPGNVLLSKHGAKVLDFGLARALADVGEGVETRTLSATAAGAIVGTLPYMAPEQIQGRDTDARTDVFALGAVLYEMLTGRRAFEATSQAGVIAAVMEGQPPSPSSLRKGVPALLERLIAQCLAKDPEARPQTAGEVARALELIGGTDPAPAARAGGSKRERLLWAALTAALLAALVVAQQRVTPAPSPAQFLVTFDVPVPAGGVLPIVVDTATPLALSPDGRHVVFQLTMGEVQQLWLHSLETKRTRPLRGTEGARGPFWSPSSRQVAFFAGGALKRVSIVGDVVQQICEVTTSFGAGTWGADDTIVFHDSNERVLMRVPAGGGTPEAVMSIPGTGGWPAFLPDDKQFLLGTSAGIFQGSLERPQLTAVVDADSFATYSSGHLLYVRDAALVAQPFDRVNGKVSGEPRVLAEGLQYFAPTGGASFSAADTGAVAYLRSMIVPRRLVWIDRSGRELGTVAPDAPWIFAPRLSPDGSRLAISQQIPSSGSIDLWLYDLPAGTPTRLTSDVAVDNWVTWWPDGRTLVFSRSGADHPPRLFTKNVTDVAPPAPLADLPGFHYQAAVVPDGSAVVYGDGGDLLVWRRGAAVAERLGRTPFVEASPAFSPDGRWLAYESDASGRSEVYVEPFGRPGERVRVSSAGGRLPRWRGDGLELFFLDPEGRLTAATLGVNGGLTVRATARVAPSGAPIQDFDVSRDGQRFVAILKDRSPEPPALTVMLNWERLLD